ncbi:MAG: tyrosine-protein phosphatase [Candidatus Hydrogenedentes bacterium]|nr:tyrosine-protein phosphatase [Candidatus Hydrogenedentota bacterium]
MKKQIAAVSAIGLVILLAPVAHLFWHYFPGYNWRTVEPGVLYGSRQMSGPVLEETIDEYGLRTVINLRSENPGADWYDAELAACQNKGIALENFPWSKNSIPDPESLLRFIDLMETGERPMLMHCQGGTHRTGTGAAIYDLLQGKSPEEAREQFTIGFNDAPIGQIVDLYEGSDLPFKEWAKTAYPSLYEQWKARQEAKPPEAE